MAINRSVDRNPVSVAEAQLARVSGDGCARHPHLLALAEGSGPFTGRDLADAVHLLCSLHGHRPGLVELVLRHNACETAREWLAEASTAFEQERQFLLRLTAAVGPIPSTPGAAATESSLQAQRHALEILAVSERRGCALGAATALVADWAAIRRVLDRASTQVGLQAAPWSLPGEEAITEVIEIATGTPGSERALSFGGEQLLLQHRALLDLLEARASARGDY